MSKEPTPLPPERLAEIERGVPMSQSAVVPPPPPPPPAKKGA